MGGSLKGRVNRGQSWAAPMTDADYDVAVVGTGPVGLAMALRLARTGRRVGLVGPAPRGADGRTAALLGPSVDLLDALGVWAALEPEAGPLRTLRIVDDTGSLFRPPPVEFRAAEIGLSAFGWNVTNTALTGALSAACEAAPGLERREGIVEAAELGVPAVTLRLAGGGTLSARLVVAADGRRSRVREAAGIATRENAYPQVAVTTLLRHARDHGDVSTEFHTREGPFTLVPLPGRRSSLVWVTRPAHAVRLATLADSDFAAAIAVRAGPLLGNLAIDGPRGATSLAAMRVDRYVAARIALAGEAAHVLPPIGAQGLNLGFADVVALAETLAGAPDPGAETVLARYARARFGDVRRRSAAVDGLNRALLSGLLPVDAARGIGLAILGQIGPLRRAAMRAGLPGRAAGSTAPVRARTAARAAPRS